MRALVYLLARRPDTEREEPAVLPRLRVTTGLDERLTADQRDEAAVNPRRRSRPASSGPVASERPAS